MTESSSYGHSVEVSWPLGPTTVYGTVVMPEGAGPFPGDCGMEHAYPPPVSAHVDDGDSVDPSRTVDNHLVAGAVAGDRGS
jgi:hypothetical protein